MKFYNEAYFSAGETLAGLGDAIVMSPIVNQMSKEYNRIYYPSRVSYYKTIKCLFQDNPRIEVFPYHVPGDIVEWLKDKDYFNIQHPDIKLTNLYYPHIGEPVPVPIYWERQVYEFYDITMSSRYSEFRLPRNIEGSDELYRRLTNGEEDYCLLHQQTFHHHEGMIDLNLQGWRSYYNLPPMKIIEIKPEITKNMLQYSKLIENAKEIHCVPSSFFNLVDSIHDRTKAALFFHDIRATSMMKVNSKWNNNRWVEVGYERKL